MLDWLVSLALAVVIVAAVVMLVYHTVPVLLILLNG
jgi:hypothetical protein